MKKILTILCATAGLLVSTSVFSQVSNDNEDGVNKVDERQKLNFVPGQAIVKFKDESSIEVKHNAQGRFRVASINDVDKILRDFGADKMEKLFPAETPKPQSQLRRKVAPNGHIVQESNLDKVFWVKTGVMSADSTMQMVKRLQELPEVEYAELNYYTYITADMPTDMSRVNMPTEEQKIRKAPASVETTASVICPNPSNNPLYSYQYGITQQNIHQLWNKPIINKKRPVIAILDTGVDINHPDLANNIWMNTKEAEGETAYDDDGNGIVDDIHGWNFVEDYYDLTDCNGHGTHCAGIAAAADNGIGIVGANPLALIMPVKVLSDKGYGDIATGARGIVYAAENGADILSMSFGTGGLPKTLKDALDFAYQTTILVASAGNNGDVIYTPLGTNYPGAYYLVLGVEANGQNGQRASFSNYDPDGPFFSEDGVDGRNYEIQIPGVDIYSTLPNGQYNKLSGTSMSAPLLAGAISALQMIKEYPSKDVLYGDLIHLKADFAKIYSDDTPRTPKIDFVTLNVDDNGEENSNIDGQVDVGETILFSPVIRNTWADATDIRLKLSVDNLYKDFVTIVNPEVDFGHSLSAYGRATAKTPIQVKFKDNIGDNTRMKFTLEASCHENTESFYQDVYMTVNNMVKLSGLITENRTLTADHAYHVIENIGIPEGVTLTIEPGTRLEFDEGVGLSSDGTLVAKGTPQKPIVFTGHNRARWAGIWSHASTHDQQHDENYIYSNADRTLFTLLPTTQTPEKVDYEFNRVYYRNVMDPRKDYLDLYEYVGGFDMDMTAHQDLLTDPSFLTPAVLKMLADAEDYLCKFPTSPTEDRQEEAYFNVRLRFPWFISENPRDTISYCRIDGCEILGYTNALQPYMCDCIYTGGYCQNISGMFGQLNGSRLVITDNYVENYSWYDLNSKMKLFPYANLVNNTFGTGTYALDEIIRYSYLVNTNYINNYYISDKDLGKYTGKAYAIGFNSPKPQLDHADSPSYLGTSREDIIRPYIFEIGNALGTYGQIDLSNMPNRPYSEAHGVVWKVCVNGKDAQDEFENLTPLGVGKHKFEVYFNRSMNKTVAPNIFYGVREPYNQHEIAEDGSWNADGTIYTVYATITGKTTSDGKNRIYVQSAEDNEFFPCPYEKDRFNFIIAAAGSLATGFSAEAKMGRVNLTWNNDENDFEDAMGFNIYRYTESERLMPVYDEWGNPVYEMDEELNYVYDENGCLIPKMELRTVADTLRLNTDIVDIETTEYTDYDVTPGETYYYMYKVLSTDLQEYDVSNVVAATPLTSTLGDANGSGEVDVADVITTVNYAAGMDPKPFIFEAADMNVDQNIDILDVVGIIQKILNPSAGAKMRVESVATYTVEDGIVYVESPVDLAGVQLQLNAPEQETPEVLNTLNGFEHASAWLTDEDYLFLGYNMNGKTIPAGKHALFNIGNAQLRSIRLSDTMGGNVTAEAGNATAIEMLTPTLTKSTHGIYNLNGQKVAGSASDLEKLPKGVYIVDGIKVVK